MTNSLKILMLLLFIYVPYIKIFGLNLPIGVFSFFVPWLFLIRDSNLYLNKQSQNLIFLIGLSLIYLVIIYLLYIPTMPLSFVDFRGLKLHIVIIFIFLSTYAIYRYFLQKLELLEFFQILYFALGINSFIVLMLYFNESFASSFYSFILVNPKIFEYPILRYPGFLYDGSSYLSVLNAIAFILGLVIFFNKKTSLISNILLFSTQTMIFLATMFVGRAGFVFIALGLFLMLFFFIFVDFRLTKELIKKIVLMLSLLVFFTITGAAVISYLEMNWYTNWAFGFIVSLFANGEVSDSTVVELTSNHYFAPSGFFNILFGILDFKSTVHATYASDSGFIIYMHGAGLFGLFFFFIFILYFILFAISNYSISKPASFMVLFVTLTLFLANGKDFYIFYPYSHYIVLFLLYLRLVDVKEKNRFYKQ